MDLFLLLILLSALSDANPANHTRRRRRERESTTSLERPSQRQRTAEIVETALSTNLDPADPFAAVESERSVVHEEMRRTLSLQNRTAIPYTYTLRVYDNSYRDNKATYLFDAFNEILSDPRYPDFTLPDQPNIDPMRLAYWVVGEIPDDWHLSLIWISHYSEYLVVFVESDTGRQTIVDPRIPLPLPDIGYEMRLDIFLDLQYHRYRRTLYLELPSRENLARDGLNLISEYSPWDLGSSSRISVKVGNETGIDQGGPVCVSFLIY
jgi:hypothetical protein